jgi:hypothetical protein
MSVGWVHRYLMTRLSLQVIYLWCHVSSTAPPFILWWSNLEILFGPLHCRSPFIGELRCQAIQTEHGPYIAERTQNAVYIVRYLWAGCMGFCLFIYCVPELSSHHKKLGHFVVYFIQSDWNWWMICTLCTDCVLECLKGQSHEKVGEIRPWDGSLGSN